MKHKVKVQVPAEKRSFFEFKKTVMETQTIEVDGKPIIRCSRNETSARTVLKK